MRARALVLLVLLCGATIALSSVSAASTKPLFADSKASALAHRNALPSPALAQNPAPLHGSQNEGWAVVGEAVNQIVNDVVIDADDNVYIAGTLSGVGGVSTAPLYMVARWNGSAWESLGGANDWVFALAIGQDGTLYAAGRFTQIGGVAASRVAMWDGSSWSAMGVGFNNPPEDLVIDAEGTVYVGGGMGPVGGGGGRGIFAWNGSEWVVPGGGSGVNNYVYSLAVDAEHLYVGGAFTDVSGVSVRNVARWDGTNWTDVGGGTQTAGATVYSLEVSPDGTLYAGGYFNEMGGTTANSLAHWDGTSWHDVAGGVTNATGGTAAVRAITFDGADVLYVAGTFSEAGGVTVNSVARLEGDAWVSLGGGIANGIVLALAVANHQPYLYAGGGFSGIGGVDGLNYFARYEGGVTAPAEVPPSHGALTLAPAYPNPFSETVLLRFTSARSEQVRLEVFDVLGRRVKMVFDGPALAGQTIEHALHSHGLPAGAYLVRLSSPAENVTQWIVLSR